MNHILAETLYLIDAWKRGADSDDYASEIAALRQVIEQAEKQKQWTPDDMAYRPGGLSMEQEPVAEVIYFDGEKIIEASMAFFDRYPIGTKLYTAPVHPIDTSEKRVDETAKDGHEPDVYGDGNVYRGQCSKDSTTKTLHYTTPPRNSWFKLTDAEIWDEWVRAVDESNRSNRELAFRFARAIEAKLKEKNT